LTITPAESQGSIATLKLAIEETEFPEEKLDTAIHSKRLKILVVDDEAEITATFSEALTLRGHEVEVDFDGESALKRIKETLFDVVVADIRMPGLTGIELYQQASARFSRMEKKFVFISGEPLSDSIRAFLDLRSTPCLVKPVDIDVLTQAIERQSITS
jgi:CheY-like chemotaxis protein